METSYLASVTETKQGFDWRLTVVAARKKD